MVTGWVRHETREIHRRLSERSDVEVDGGLFEVLRLNRTKKDLVLVGGVAEAYYYEADTVPILDAANRPAPDRGVVHVDEGTTGVVVYGEADGIRNGPRTSTGGASRRATNPSSRASTSSSPHRTTTSSGGQTSTGRSFRTLLGA